MLAGGISSRHSGIIRSANASIQAATFAEQANEMWRNIDRYWGVGIKNQKSGAIWIAKNDKEYISKAIKYFKKALSVDCNYDLAKISLNTAKSITHFK